LPLLPALVDWDLPGGNESFLYDFTRTVSDQLIFSHYTTGSAFLADYGMDLVAEAGGPGPPIWDSCPVDALKALGNVSVPRGEFWVRNRHNIFLVKEVASASHIYGLDIVDAESFTTWRRWKDAPHALKQHGVKAPLSPWILARCWMWRKYLSTGHPQECCGPGHSRLIFMTM